MCRNRVGATLPELLVALVCGALVIQLALHGLALTRSVGADLYRRSERLAALRVARVSLRGELHAGVAGRDWSVSPPDSLRVRAYRGRALVCPVVAAGATELAVSWEGTRRPESGKDSLMLLDENGDWTPVDLVAVGSWSGPCGAAAGGDIERWQISAAPSGQVVLARLFESVSYHFAERALRVRRGAGGRQPLTPQVLATPGSGFVAQGVSVGVRLEASLDTSWSWAGYLAPRR